MSQPAYLSNLRGTGLSVFGLTPATETGAPDTGTFALGELWLDADGVYWRCTAAGTPGTWEELGTGGGGSGDMLKADYDSNNDGIVDAAEAVPWTGVTGKPSTFPPDTHSHVSTDVTDFTEAAQDATGAMIDSSLVYTDATPLLSRAALTGDVTASAGSNSTTIANGAVTNAKLADMAEATVKGRASGAGTGAPTDLTPAQIATILAGLVNVWPRPGKVNIGMTEYSSFAAAAAAAVAGDLIVVGVGTFTCDNITIPAGVMVIGCGEFSVLTTSTAQYVVQAAGAITLANIRLENSYALNSGIIYGLHQPYTASTFLFNVTAIATGSGTNSSAYAFSVRSATVIDCRGTAIKTGSGAAYALLGMNTNYVYGGRFDGGSADIYSSLGATIRLYGPVCANASVTNSNILTGRYFNNAGEVVDLNLTASRALVTDANKKQVSSAVTDTELGYLSGVTSAIQTQLNGKQATGNYLTALTGDVTASGPGSAAATIASNAITLAKLASDAKVDSQTHAATSKATPVDNDEIPLADSAASYGLKKLLWSALKTTLGFVSNKLGLAYGGTGADLSATGGSGQYVKQASAGGALTVGVQALNDAKVSKLRESDDGGDALTADASGNLTASANLLVDTGYTQVRQLVSKRNLSIADDTAVSHQSMAAGNRFMFSIVTNDGEWFFGVCTYNGITSIAKSTNFNIVAGGGTLTGTTGTDARWNIRDNNGVLYIENRRGSSLNAGVTFFGSD